MKNYVFQKVKNFSEKLHFLYYVFNMTYKCLSSKWYPIYIDKPNLKKNYGVVDHLPELSQYLISLDLCMILLIIWPIE